MFYLFIFNNPSENLSDAKKIINKLRCNIINKIFPKNINLIFIYKKAKNPRTTICFT